MAETRLRLAGMFRHSTTTAESSVRVATATGLRMLRTLLVLDKEGRWRSFRP
jgi:hypothetical protein